MLASVEYSCVKTSSQRTSPRTSPRRSSSIRCWSGSIRIEGWIRSHAKARRRKQYECIYHEVHKDHEARIESTTADSKRLCVLGALCGSIHSFYLAVKYSSASHFLWLR